MSITREQAWDLLTKYNEEPFHLRHAITVEHVMGWFADKLGYGDEKEFWSIVGLLHDLDFERWPRGSSSSSWWRERFRGRSSRSPFLGTNGRHSTVSAPAFRKIRGQTQRCWKRWRRPESCP